MPTDTQLKPARKGTVAYRKLLKKVSEGHWKSYAEPEIGRTSPFGGFFPSNDPNAEWDVVNDVIQPDSRREMLEAMIPTPKNYPKFLLKIINELEKLGSIPLSKEYPTLLQQVAKAYLNVRYPWFTKKQSMNFIPEEEFIENIGNAAGVHDIGNKYLPLGVNWIRLPKDYTKDPSWSHYFGITAKNVMDELPEIINTAMHETMHGIQDMRYPLMRKDYPKYNSLHTPTKEEIVLRRQHPSEIQASLAGDRATKAFYDAAIGIPNLARIDEIPVPRYNLIVDIFNQAAQRAQQLGLK